MILELTYLKVECRKTLECILKACVLSSLLSPEKNKERLENNLWRDPLISAVAGSRSRCVYQLERGSVLEHSTSSLARPRVA